LPPGYEKDFKKFSVFLKYLYLERGVALYNLITPPPLLLA
jgi:hypothetical protein